MKTIRKRILLFTFILTAFFAVTLSSQEVPPQNADLPLAGSYKIVPEKSRILVKVGTAGVFGFMGHSHSISPQSFTGEVNVGSQEVAPASVRLRIDATTLKELAEFSKEDLNKIERDMHEKVLETKTYPQIMFQSSNVTYSKAQANNYSARIEGELTLHGVTRTVAIPAQITIDGSSLRAVGEFELKRKDYNIKTDSAGGGTVKVANTLEVTFDVVAIQ